MQEEYNLPALRENFIFSSIKKIFQGMFNVRRRKRDQKRRSIMAQRAKQRQVELERIEMPQNHQKVDIYEFQAMYKRGEIPIENMNEDQKYALIKLFEMQNERLRESIEVHKKNTIAYNAEVDRLKRELDIIQ